MNSCSRGGFGSNKGHQEHTGLNGSLLPWVTDGQEIFLVTNNRVALQSFCCRINLCVAVHHKLHFDCTMAEESGASDLFAGLTLSNSPKHSARKTTPKDVPPLTGGTTRSTENHVEPPSVVTRAPVTDKLLAMMGTPPSSPTSASAQRTRPVEVEQVSKPAMNGTHAHKSTAASEETPTDASGQTNDELMERKPSATVIPKEKSSHQEEKKESSLTPVPVESVKRDDGKPAPLADDDDDDRKPAAVLPAQEPTSKAEEDRKPFSRETRRQAGLPQEIEDAFHLVTKEEAAAVGQIHPDTPIPNADAALRLLRKFAAKTRPQIPKVCGGTQSRSMFGYLFGKSQEDPTMEPYAKLMEILFDGEEQVEEDEDNDVVLESILGHGSDNMAKARLAVAAFCNTCSLWCHASARMLDESKSFLLGHAMDTCNSIGSTRMHGQCHDWNSRY